MKAAIKFKIIDGTNFISPATEICASHLPKFSGKAQKGQTK
jgi:hypothetical protein